MKNSDGFVMVYKLDGEVTQLPKSRVIRKVKKTWLETLMEYSFLLKIIKPT